MMIATVYQHDGGKFSRYQVISPRLSRLQTLNFILLQLQANTCTCTTINVRNNHCRSITKTINQKSLQNATKRVKTNKKQTRTPTSSDLIIPLEVVVDELDAAGARGALSPRGRLPGPRSTATLLKTPHKLYNAHALNDVHVFDFTHLVH